MVDSSVKTIFHVMVGWFCNKRVNKAAPLKIMDGTRWKDDRQRSDRDDTEAHMLRVSHNGNSS